MRVDCIEFKTFSMCYSALCSTQRVGAEHRLTGKSCYTFVSLAQSLSKAHKALVPHANVINITVMLSDEYTGSAESFRQPTLSSQYGAMLPERQRERERKRDAFPLSTPKCGKQNNDKRTFSEWFSRCLFHIASSTISISYRRATYRAFCINITSGWKKTFQEQFLSGSEWCVFLIRLGLTSAKKKSTHIHKKAKIAKKNARKKIN